MWYLDSGCSTKHMTEDKTKFLSLSVYEGGIIISAYLYIFLPSNIIPLVSSVELCGLNIILLEYFGLIP